MTAGHWRLWPVQLPVPPPAPPVPPPGAPVPPPAPLPGPLTPVVPLDELGPRLLLLLPEGSLGRLLSGSRVELRVAPGAVPGAPGTSPGAAKVARDVADNNPAKSSEVILMFIMVVSRDESLPDVGVKGHAVGADRLTSGADLTVTGTGPQWGRHLILRSARSGRSCGSLRSTSITCAHGYRSC
jgi:hypothetical protein